MTDQHFQREVISALKGIERILKESTANLGLRQPEMPFPDKGHWDEAVVGVNTPEVSKTPRFNLAHICVRAADNRKLMPYPRSLCSMCQARDSIDIFIEENNYAQLEVLLKSL